MNRREETGGGGGQTYRGEMETCPVRGIHKTPVKRKRVMVKIIPDKKKE